MRTYRSARGLATAAILLVALQAAAYAYAAVVSLIVLSDFSKASILAPLASAGMLMPVYIAALVVFMCWVHRSVSNLTALGSESMMSPSSAVWSFFIPFVNIVQPLVVMTSIWRHSQPPQTTDAGYLLPARATIVKTWWVLTVIATIVTQVSSRFMSAPTSREELSQLLAFMAADSIMWVVAGVLFIRMVQRTQARQDEQWNDLELRRAAPQPDSNVLR